MGLNIDTTASSRSEKRKPLAWSMLDVGERIPLRYKIFDNLVKLVNPMDLIRSSGSTLTLRVIKMVSASMKRHLYAYVSDPEVFFKYMCEVNMLRPMGEEAFRIIAGKHGYPLNPLLTRFKAAAVSDKLPIWFIYGSDSWISSENGTRMASIRSAAARTTVKV